MRFVVLSTISNSIRDVCYEVKGEFLSSMSILMTNFQDPGLHFRIRNIVTDHSIDFVTGHSINYCV